MIASIRFESSYEWILYLLPLVAALIGWFTNYIAVKMLFHPKNPKGFLFVKIQGVFPKRQKALAQKLGDLVAEELFSVYHNRVPFVRTLMKSVSNRAQQRGQIRTLLGRLCRFHLWEPNSFGMHKALPFEQAVQEHGPGIKRAYTYKALNKLIQGSAADMTKKSMLDLYKEGIIPHIQIHDELDISVENDKQAKLIKEVMESAVDLEIPNKVDYESGKNWGDIH